MPRTVPAYFEEFPLRGGADTREPRDFCQTTTFDRSQEPPRPPATHLQGNLHIRVLTKPITREKDRVPPCLAWRFPWLLIVCRCRRALFRHSAAP